MRLFHHVPLAVLLAVLLAAPALAQESVTLRPGHPDLMTAGLTLDSETVGVRVAEPRPQDLGTVTSTVTRDGDTVTLVTDADVPQANQVHQTTTTFEWPSLAPVMRERSSGGSSGTTQYDGARVTGSYGRGEWGPLSFDITLDAPAFQPEVLPILARALPFREGYTATVPTFTSERRVRDYTLQVVGQEEHARPDGSTVTAWVVEESSTGRGSVARRYFVDPATRDLIATTYTARGNTTIVSEPVTEEALAALEGDAATPAVALRPGLGRLETDALEGYSQDYVIRVVEPVQQEAGTMSRALTVDREAGTVTLETETEIAIAGQQTSETLVAAYPSLAPISNVTDANGNLFDLEYSDATVTGTRTVDGQDAEAIDIALEEPVYDGSWLFEVVRLLPFEEGYRAAFHTVSPSTEAATAVELTVVEQNEVDGRTAWIVEARPEEGAPTEFAVDAETRDLLRVRLQPQVGVVIDIVPADG